MTNHLRSAADLVAALKAEADDIASPQELQDRATAARPVPLGRRRRWLAPAGVIASIVLVATAALTVRSTFPQHSRPATSPAQVPAATTKQVTFHGVQLAVPTAWPLIDGAHAAYTCSSTFQGQSDRVFLGSSLMGAPSCAPRAPNATLPGADGVWMQQGGSTPPDQATTTLGGGQQVYLTTTPNSSVDVWYHGVSVQIGIGPDPAIGQAILDSISYNAKGVDSSILGRCPTPGSFPTKVPTPTRATTQLVLDDSNGRLDPEPATVQPHVSAATVWESFRHGFGKNISGSMTWNVTFGSYSAQTPAHINPDNSTTPFYTNVPTWLIRGGAIETPYGPCGITILAPYNADTGQSMGVTTHG